MDVLVKVISAIMLMFSMAGFMKLLYYEKWGRSLVAAFLTGVSLYIAVFF